MNLTAIAFTPKSITKGIGVIRQMKSLGNLTIGLRGDKGEVSSRRILEKIRRWRIRQTDAFALTPAISRQGKRGLAFNDPACQQWMKTVAALPAEKQIEAVVKKLQELNPGF